ncbi:MAG: uracil phosphoribosyltransferase [Acidobacteria bacterium]|nr:uracil phosphoribosyltransferase [Acidobacteriota bacterium]
MPLHIVAHPLAQEALALLRDRQTPPERFRRAASRLSVLLAVEATRDLPTCEHTVQSPLGVAVAHRLAVDLVIVPVLRAGLGMLDALLALVPQARVGHIGLQRDEATAIASQYYARLPSGLARSQVLMIDPMLATGGSASAAVGILKAAGARDIRIICIVAAPEGVAAIERAHPDVVVYAPVVDSHLNAQKFIVPGLGDFGDRLYGTV